LNQDNVVHECGNCSFYLKSECPREYSKDTDLWRRQVPCEIFKPMADEERRMFYQKLQKEAGDYRVEEKPVTKGSMRDSVFAIFLLVFLIGTAVSLIVLTWFRESLGLSFPLGLLVFFGSVFLGICFLMAVYWVAEDKKQFDDLKRQVEELKEKTKVKD